MALAKQKFIFTILATLVLTTKVVHIYANAKALALKQIALWGYSFFAQDLLLLSVFRFLFASSLYASRRRRQCFLTLSSWLVNISVAYIVLVSFSSIIFFAYTGSEIHYRNIDFVKDASARALLLTGLLSAAVATGIVCIFSWLVQTPVYFAFGLPADAVRLGWSLCKTCVLRRGSLSDEVDFFSHFFSYVPVPQSTDATDLEKCGLLQSDEDTQSYRKKLAWYLGCVLATAVFVVEAGFLLCRPSDSSLIFLSWTAPFLPFIDFGNSSPSLRKLAPIYNAGIGHSWDNRSALGEPPQFPWLPPNAELSGFEDWYGNSRQHYNAANDPLKSTDPLSELLPGLREHLKDVKIRHVVLLLLESTRKDLFPVKKDGLIWNRFAETYPDGKLPPHARERLKTLTLNAKHLTGDFDDGFDHTKKSKDGRGKARGGISFDNAYTSGTYTLKSTVGTLCGIHPLIADFTLEFQHHIYQPCLPHILEAFNSIEERDGGHDFASTKWRSSFMQTYTVEYDNMRPLLQGIGFSTNQTISKEDLRKPTAKFGKVTIPDVNYFGMPEYPLQDYIRDAFTTAKENRERVFLTHLTSTSHHPYTMPANETYVPLGHRDALSDMSHYVNAIGYDDRWIGQILDILDDEDVADETLVVVHGDHGISIPENDILASYYNPNVGCDHVPLIFSHPKLPPLQIKTPVSTVQILPTILDLLAETKSLSRKSTRAARDLMSNFEGTSLLRQPNPKNNTDADAAAAEHHPSSNLDKWQFVVMNPGRAMIGVRHADHKDFRLVVPVLSNVVWRFTNISADPREEHPTVSFDFEQFLKEVEREHGLEAAKWAEEAAFVSRWWVEENSKRWQYGQYASSSASAL